MKFAGRGCSLLILASVAGAAAVPTLPPGATDDLPIPDGWNAVAFTGAADPAIQATTQAPAQSPEATEAPPATTFEPPAAFATASRLLRGEPEPPAAPPAAAQQGSQEQEPP